VTGGSSNFENTACFEVKIWKRNEEMRAPPQGEMATARQGARGRHRWSHQTTARETNSTPPARRRKRPFTTHGPDRYSTLGEYVVTRVQLVTHSRVVLCCKPFPRYAVCILRSKLSFPIKNLVPVHFWPSAREKRAHP